MTRVRGHRSAAGGREGGSPKMHNSNEKAYSKGYANGIWANWASEGGDAQWRESWLTWQTWASQVRPQEEFQWKFDF
jgi:hypothetical protein